MYTFDPYSRDGFKRMFLDIRSKLVAQPSVDVGEWQSQHKEGIMMKELLGVVFEWPMPLSKETLAEETGARLPWAEDHFLERVSGQPMNPSPSEAWWPFAKKGETTNADHKSEGEAFSHTYPERMWPKRANPEMIAQLPTLENTEVNVGIRFAYGDLTDVVRQLIAHPMTRQAYLPIWFPEDTGAVHGKRVPCTLGYHFMIRDGMVHLSYFMRSTDLLRHFQDDVYLAVRLAQWVCEQISSQWEKPLIPGNLTFHTANMHIFEQDTEMISFWESQGKTWF